MRDSPRVCSLSFRSLLLFLLLTTQSAGWSSPERRTSSKPFRPVTAPKKKSKTEKGASEKSAAPKEKTKSNLPKSSLPQDEPEKKEALEPETIVPPLPVEEADKVKWMFPNRAVAHIEEDPNFRLLVTVDGTIFEKETDGSYHLTKGSILACPAKKSRLYTPHCSIELREGSVVTLDASPLSTYIRDFHDRWKGHVIVNAESKTIFLMPGMELVITSETDATKAWQQAIKHPIRRRDLTKTFDGPKVVVFKGDFSILDAMLKSELFLLLKTSSEADAGDVIDEVTKTAALLHITDHKGPYIFMLP